MRSRETEANWKGAAPFVAGTPLADFVVRESDDGSAVTIGTEPVWNGTQGKPLPGRVSPTLSSGTSGVSRFKNV